MYTLIEKVMVLQNAQLFSEFPTTELSLLANIAINVTAEAGAVLYRENEPSDTLYIVEEGLVNMIKNNVGIYQVNQYDALGTFGFFTHEPRLFTAQCVDRSRFVLFNRTTFFDLLEHKSNMALCFLKYFLKSAVLK
jgi:CRP-like cAMP-binding protein